MKWNRCNDMSSFSISPNLRSPIVSIHTHIHIPRACNDSHATLTENSRGIQIIQIVGSYSAQRSLSGITPAYPLPHTTDPLPAPFLYFLLGTKRREERPRKNCSSASRGASREAKERTSHCFVCGSRSTRR